MGGPDRSAMPLARVSTHALVQHALEVTTKSSLGGDDPPMDSGGGGRSRLPEGLPEGSRPR